jgi:hypothetical protein
MLARAGATFISFSRARASDVRPGRDATGAKSRVWSLPTGKLDEPASYGEHVGPAATVIGSSGPAQQSGIASSLARAGKQPPGAQRQSSSKFIYG